MYGAAIKVLQTLVNNDHDNGKEKCAQESKVPFIAFGLYTCLLVCLF